MTASVPDESWKEFASTLRRLLSRPELRSSFQQDVNGTRAAAELKIPHEMQADLKQILLMMSISRDESSGGDPGHRDSIEKQALSAQGFYEATYKNLRRGAIATMVMSVLIFAMGLFLLAVAAWEALSDDSQGATIALGATGIVAVAAAFYQSPVAQMRASAAEVQRSSMVLMSYMLGMSLVGRSLDGEEIGLERETLIALTNALVELLPSQPAA